MYVEAFGNSSGMRKKTYSVKLQIWNPIGRGNTKEEAQADLEEQLRTIFEDMKIVYRWDDTEDKQIVRLARCKATQ